MSAHEIEEFCFVVVGDKIGISYFFCAWLTDTTGERRTRVQLSRDTKLLNIYCQSNKSKSIPVEMPNRGRTNIEELERRRCGITMWSRDQAEYKESASNGPLFTLEVHVPKYYREAKCQCKYIGRSSGHRVEWWHPCTNPGATGMHHGHLEGMKKFKWKIFPAALPTAYSVARAVRAGKNPAPFLNPFL